MIEIKIATKDDIDCLMSVRLEMLKVVNDLSEDYVFSDELLIKKTWEKGATEISLDATALGRPLYESIGFTDSTEYMVLTNM